MRGSTLPKIVECLDEGVGEVGKWRVVEERVGRGEELGGGEGCVWRECGSGETSEARDESEPLHSIMEAITREEESVFFTHTHTHMHTHMHTHTHTRTYIHTRIHTRAANLMTCN